MLISDNYHGSGKAKLMPAVLLDCHLERPLGQVEVAGFPPLLLRDDSGQRWVAQLCAVAQLTATL